MQSTAPRSGTKKAGGGGGEVKAQVKLDEAVKSERRSSPRLRAIVTAKQIQERGDTAEQARHDDLAALLFPPSPPVAIPVSPRPPSSSSSSSSSSGQGIFPVSREEREVGARTEREQSVVSDSEEERQREWKEGREERRRENWRRDRQRGAERGLPVGRGKGKGAKELEEEGENIATPRPRARKPRPSITYNLSSSSSSSASSDEDEMANRWALPSITPRASVKGKRRMAVQEEERIGEHGEEADLVADSFGGLSLNGASLPRLGAKSLTPSPALSRPFSDSANPPFSSSSTPSAKKQRLKRRITISVISSSSSSSGSDEEEVQDSCPSPVKRKAKKKAGQKVKMDENEEILAACTDDEIDGDGGRAGGTEDVQDYEGVYIYHPTPKKRPVKLSSSTCDSPFSPPITASEPPRTPSLAGKRSTSSTAKKVAAAKSRLGKEIDLTESGSSEEDELPPPSRVFPSSSTSSTPRPKSTPRFRPPLASFVSPSPTEIRASPAIKSSAKGIAPSKAAKRTTLTPSDRSSLPLLLIRELDKRVFKRRWEGMRCVEGEGKGLPAEIEIVWSNRLRITAGRASWKTTKHCSPSKPHLPPRVTHHALIELATKVVDTPEKLKHTLSHELCHLAAWAIDGEMKPPHGVSFKMWAKRIMLLRPDISVTTTHSYEIVYKYRWKCVSGVCGKIYGRHSNSINPQTHGCNCGARLVAIDKEGKVKPIAGSGMGGGPGEGGGVETPRKKSKWQEFMATESPRLRASNPSMPQSEILKLVAERWKVVKAAAAEGAGNHSVESSARREKNRRDNQYDELEVKLGGLSL
ncbi:hypothetical protein JCM11251_007095 [Rhodosporidiobolus azoricus]